MGAVAGPCENDNESSVSVEEAEFLNLVKLLASLCRGGDVMTPVCVLGNANE
jgi:hypothetical protein